MMKLKDETIKEFCQIVSEEYGIQIASEKAEELTYKLLGYFDLLAKIHHSEIKITPLPL